MVTTAGGTLVLLSDLLPVVKSHRCALKSTKFVQPKAQKVSRCLSVQVRRVLIKSAGHEAGVGCPRPWFQPRGVTVGPRALSAASIRRGGSPSPGSHREMLPDRAGGLTKGRCCEGKSQGKPEPQQDVKCNDSVYLALEPLSELCNPCC